MIPKSHSADRIRENIEGPQGWMLNAAEMADIDSLDEGNHCRGDDPAIML